MVVGLHEVVDREVILAVVEASAAADDLLELDHRVDGPHQHDITDVAGIDAGRELLRRGQDRRNGLLVILERAKPLVAQRAVLRRHPNAVARVTAFLHLVDEVANSAGVLLRRAEDERLLALVDHVHEGSDPIRLALADDDRAVEGAFGVGVAVRPI